MLCCVVLALSSLSGPYLVQRSLSHSLYSLSPLTLPSPPLFSFPLAPLSTTPPSPLLSTRPIHPSLLPPPHPHPRPTHPLSLPTICPPPLLSLPLVPPITISSSTTSHSSSLPSH
ncbi:hypothetical protein Pcinc_017345 [Petrolisthes cinctipes]|uniref:Uncharacterized protein n=1 Tax=Petrolisthes cinctipes TaxID=88211 RepID=A0AAE1KMW3_PETCI|nr:hypothetical protein Pcinc_017345 [Petrolisthes cinctipes]